MAIKLLQEYQNAFEARRFDVISLTATLGITASEEEINAESRFRASADLVSVLVRKGRFGYEFNQALDEMTAIEKSKAYRSMFKKIDEKTEKLTVGDTYEVEKHDTKGRPTGEIVTRRIAAIFQVDNKNVTELMQEVVKSMSPNQSFLTGENWRDDPKHRFDSDPNAIYVTEATK